MQKETSEIKILYLIDNSKLGGVQKYIYYLISGLSYNYKKYLLCPNDGDFFSIFKRLNINLIESNLNFAVIPRIIALLKKEKIKLIHANLGKAKLISGIIKKLYPNIKIIFTEHFENPSHLVLENKTLYGTFSKFVHKRLINHIDSYIAISDSVKNMLVEKEGVPERKISKIYNGVPISYQKITNRATDNGKKKILFCAGRLSMEKGYHHVIKSLKILTEKKLGYDLNLIISGIGKEEKTLKTLANSLGLIDKVKFTGFISDIYNMLEKVDIFIQPSLTEGLGIAILEAMSMGIPVIASDCGGIKEILKDGINGFLVPPGAEKLIAEKVVELLLDNNKFDSISKEAVKTVKENFSLTKMINQTEKCYIKLLTNV